MFVIFTTGNEAYEFSKTEKHNQCILVKLANKVEAYEFSPQENLTYQTSPWCFLFLRILPINPLSKISLFIYIGKITLQ